MFAPPLGRPTTQTPSRCCIAIPDSTRAFCIIPLDAFLYAGRISFSPPSTRTYPPIRAQSCLANLGASINNCRWLRCILQLHIHSHVVLKIKVLLKEGVVVQEGLVESAQAGSAGCAFLFPVHYSTSQLTRI